MQGSTLADIDYPDLCIFIFKENCTFMEEKDNPVEKVNKAEEELDGIEIYVILNFENSFHRLIMLESERSRWWGRGY